MFMEHETHPCIDQLFDVWKITNILFAAFTSYRTAS